MADTVTTITHQSWGSRLGSSLKGVLCGVGIIFASIWLLVWNEGNTVAAHKALHEAEQLTVRYPPPPASNTTESVDLTFEGKLVYVTGTVQTSAGLLEDEDFGVVASQPLLKLQRTAEMYQWAETKSTDTKKNTGGSTTTQTTYTYRKQWSSGRIESADFNDSENHVNPQMPVSSMTKVADPITFRGYTLYDAVVNKMNWFQPATDSALSMDVANIPESQTSLSSYTVSSYSGDGAKGKGFYLSSAGTTSGNPAIGDVKITYQLVPSSLPIAIIGQQSQNTLTNWISSNGRPMLLVEKGMPSVAEMYLHANNAATAQAWMFRFLGFFLMWIALQMIIKPLLVFSDVIPCLGNLLESLGCCFTGLISGVVSAVVIAISWIAVRPVLSIALFAAIAVIIYYLNRKQRQQGIAQTAVAYELTAPRTSDGYSYDLELRQQPEKEGYSDVA